MADENIFSFVKSRVTLSDFVRTLPSLTSITSTGRGKWRCNNVISGGTNATSMVIDDDTGFFKVFSHDQQYGDVITLYQLTLGDESESAFSQAIGLAEHMGVVIDESLLNNYADSISSTQIISALETLARRAHNYLMTSDNKDAEIVREYLFDERGLSEKCVREWKLGMFPESTKAMNSLTSGISSDVLVESGIASSKRSSFIAMQGRLVYPIFSSSGKVISFSSRVVDGVDTPLPDSKYINTSSTKVYDKSQTLYGQHLISKHTTEIVVCEGNMDVIALNDATDSNIAAVATCGTALTRGHVSMLSAKKNISVVNIMFDSDDAGKDAASSAIWLHNHWDDVYSLPVVGGKDPWDVYSSGNDFSESFRKRTSLMTFSVEHKHKSLDKKDFLQWCSSALSSLNFIDDREMLIHDITSESGVSRKALLASTQQSRTPDNIRHQDVTSVLSESLREVIPALLTLDSVTRRIVAFPILISSSQELAFSVCGCESDDDEDALYALVSGKKSEASRTVLSEVFSLYPEEDKIDEVIIHAARYIARSLMFSWRYDEKTPPVVRFIPAITAISQGLSSAESMDQISCVFEAVATTSMTAREE